MTDIVERLRDEIDRLRAQIIKLEDDCQVFMTSNAGLTTDLLEARAQIAAIEATDRRLIEENGRLEAQIARLTMGGKSHRPEEENEAYRDAMESAGRGHLLR